MRKYFSYFKILTFRKFWNFIEIETSRLLSLLIKTPIVRGVPCTISIEPSCLCSLRCPECPTGLGSVRRKNSYLDMLIYRKIIDEIKTRALTVFLYFQGEPLMSRDIVDMVKYASEGKLYTIISSNGQLLKREICKELVHSGLNEIIISVDGTDQGTYEKYRKGGKLEVILEGTKYLNQFKKELNTSKPEIIYQFLVFRHNESQLNEFKTFAKKSGAGRIYIKSAQVIQPGNVSETIPGDPRYSRYYYERDGRFRIKSNLGNRCHRLWRTCVITTDGDVVPCCFDKGAKYVMGNVKDNLLNEIWKNEKYMKFRKEVMTRRKELGICNNCTEGLKKEC